MGTLRAASHLRILGPSWLLWGALLFGCDRLPANPGEPSPTSGESAQGQALSATVASSTAAPSASPGTPGKADLDEFKQALLHKVDRTRWRGGSAPRPASEPAPGEGILHMPDGQGVHAAILVKNADGTVRRECVSSAAEVSALVEEIRKGRTP